MKKVFSTEKYLEWGKNKAHQHWWVKCNGLTEEEMLELGYLTMEDWLVEVEDDETN